MRVLLVGDPHLKLNRKEDAQEFLLQLHSHLIENQYDYVIILGDLFDTFAVVRSEILALWSSFFMSSAGFSKYILLVGNHDMAGADGGVSALEAFKAYPNVTVVDTLQNLPFSNVYFAPFVRSNDEFAKMAKSVPADSILVCHQSFQGAQFENGMYDPHGADTACVSHLAGVISGHVHKEQKFANIWYPGTPFQHTFGDAGHDKGLYEIYITEMDRRGYEFVRRIPLNMPTFEVIEADTITELLEKLPTPNHRTHYKVVARGTPAEIAQFWASDKVRAFKAGSRRVVDALASINPTAQVVKVTGTTQAEKLKSYVEAKKWRTDNDRILKRAASFLNGDAGR